MKNHIHVRSCCAVSRHGLTCHVTSLCTFCPTGDKVDSVPLLSSEDRDAPDNKPLPETIASVSSTPSPLWITARAATASNTLAESVYKSLTTSSLLMVLMHTTQPMFNGKMKHSRAPFLKIYIIYYNKYNFYFQLKVYLLYEEFYTAAA